MTQRIPLFLSAGATLMLALLVMFHPEPAVVLAPSATAATPALPAAAPQPQRYELVIEQGRLQSGPALIRVRQGDTLTLNLRSDRHDELHLHGYDLSLELHPGVAADLTLVAERSGRFDFELHHAHLDLGALEVLPR